MSRIQALPAALPGLNPRATEPPVGTEASSLGVRTSPGAQHDDRHPANSINRRTAEEVIAQLNLIPNVEKGYYVETFRDPANVTTVEGGSPNRTASTAIYYLLEGAAGFSRWHRLDAAEVWHYYAGAPLSLYLARDDGTPVREANLGPDVFAAQAPQAVVGKWEWQRARSWGDWTLVGTTVAPGFDMNGFELADEGWVPNAS